MHRVLVVLAALLFAAAPAGAASLPSVPSGARPGPDLLYADAPSAPQLSNAGIWKADPILVSGMTAYRDGEFLYQDFLYDDHGANGGARDPGDPRAGGDTFSAPNGTYTYPTSAAYAGNAADLVELRVRPLADALAFRVTLNTLKDPDKVAFTLGLGERAVAGPVPFAGTQTTSKASAFVTVHGTTGTVTEALTNRVLGTASVSVDRERRQFDVRVPNAAFDPGSDKLRVSAGVGLWSTAASAYLVPKPAADATTPGGSGALPTPTPFFNLAFRSSEPDKVAFTNPTEPVVDPIWWRDRLQAQGLRAGNFDAFATDVDLAKLAARSNDDSGVRQTGQLDRILASRFDDAQGTDFSATCGKAFDCRGELRGQLVPYAIYVPKKPRPSAGFGLTLLLHSLGANYNQFLGTNNQTQFGERATGSIVITPSGRGPDGWYYGHAGADTFEVWADVARHYSLDPAYTSIAGYSMGGYGTFKFATQFPDLFAKGQPTVGPPGLGAWLPPAPPTGGAASNTNRMLASVRNVPFEQWNATTDELVPFSGPTVQARTFDDLGYRYTFKAYSPAEHLTLAAQDEFGPAADFLGSSKVDRDPAHVTYVVNPTMDFADLGTRADHAYWTAGLRLRDATGDAPLGTIDARSHGFGGGDPKPSETKTGGGTLGPGNVGTLTYVEQSKTWGGAPAAAKEDVLDVRTANLRSASVDLARARLTCAARVDLTTDGPMALDFGACNRSIAVTGAGTTSMASSLPAKAACASRRTIRLTLRRPRGARVLRATISVNGKRKATLKGRSPRRATVSLKGLPRGRFTVKLVTRLRVKGKNRTVTETRRYRTCTKRA